MADVQINVINRSVEILPPTMPNVDKVAKMARICYKAEKNMNHETDVRIIKTCIREGHESVLEHGAISLFINSEVTEDSKFFSQFIKDNPDVNFTRIWEVAKTDGLLKYCERFMEPELYDKFKERHGIENDERRVLPCYIADIRAWRLILREKFYSATANADSLSLILTIKVLQELNLVDGENIFFGDIVDQVNESFKNPNVQDMVIIGDSVKEELKDFTVDGIANYFFKDKSTCFAGQASRCATLSVILTTDRATTHQLVRHRKNVAYSQESQRYVNYDKKGFSVIPLTVEPTKYPLDFIEDWDTGRVDSNTVAYDVWYKAMQNAFSSYVELLHLYDPENAGPGFKNLPPETCRGVLPNDTATKIGVTWFMQSSFVNLCRWRIDSHAQYAIRSTIAYIVLYGCLNHHPFFDILPHQAVIKWLEQIKEQKLFNDNALVENALNQRKKMLKIVENYIKQHKEELEKQRDNQ